MAQSEDLHKRLARRQEIKISLVGRKSGRTIVIPVWFVLEQDYLYLLPVSGSDTQWFKNLEHNRFIGISAGGWEANFKGRILRAKEAVKQVIERFREKYGTADVKKYYSKLDVAVRVSLSEPGSAVA